MIRHRRKRLAGKAFFLLVLAAIFSGSGVTVFAEGLLDDLGITAEGSLNFYFKYVWRGFTLDEDPVIQPGVSFSKNGFTLGFWSSWDAKNQKGTQSDEIDYCVDYTTDLTDLVNVSAGHTYYDFPASDAKSREFYLGLGLALPVETSLTWYRDYGDENDGGGDGHYISLDLAYSIPLIEDKRITFDLGAHAGYNKELFISGKGYDLGLSAGLTIPLTGNLSISPTVNYSVPYEDLEDPADGNQDKRFYAGLGFSYTF